MSEDVDGVSDTVNDIQSDVEKQNEEKEINDELRDPVGVILDSRVSSWDTCDGIPLLFSYPSKWTAYCPGDSYTIDGETVFTTSENEMQFLDKQTMRSYEEIAEKELVTEGPQHPLSLSYVESDDLSGEAQRFIDETGLDGLITSELATDLFESIPVEIYEVDGLYQESIYFVQYSTYILRFRGPDAEEIEQVIASLQ